MTKKHFFFFLLLSFALINFSLGCYFRINKLNQPNLNYQQETTHLNALLNIDSSDVDYSKLLFLTEDKSIKSVMIQYNNCNHPVFYLLMPDGDGFVGLWQKFAQSIGYQTSYLFIDNRYLFFPRTQYWQHFWYRKIQSIFINQDKRQRIIIAEAYAPQCPPPKLLPFFF